MATSSVVGELLLVLGCLASLSSGQGHTPRHPQPSESSTAHITSHYPDYPNTQPSSFMETGNIVTYKYDLYKNYGTGNMLYAYKIGTYADYGTRYYLIRDDLSTTFEYYEPFGTCGKPYLLEGSPGLGFPARWTWLNETKYSGSVKFHKKDVDLWTYTYHDDGSDTSTFQNIGVLKKNPNILNFYFMYTVNGAGFSLSVYDKFKNGDPPDAVFNVPAICPGGDNPSSDSVHSGETPQRPVLSESFTAEISYVRTTFYVSEETLKPAKLYRNFHTKKQLQVNPLGQTTFAGSYKQLLRMDQKKLFSFFEPFGSCHVTLVGSQSDEDLPVPHLDQPMWEWLKSAKFTGVKKFRRQNLNWWTHTNNETNTFHSLGVSRSRPNTPVVMFELNTYYRYKRKVTVFSKYQPGPPRERVFEVPQGCASGN